MSKKIDAENFQKSNYVCMMPWTHLHFWPDSTAHLCCVSDSTKPLGRYAGNLEEIYNSERMRQVRQSMLADEPVSECERCYQLEKNNIYSLRNNSNYKYSRYFESANKTNLDGSVEQFIIRYLDIRFSNMCNLRCRSCGPSLSSAWFPDQVQMYPNWAEPQHYSIDRSDNFLNSLKPSLNHVEEAYFAGGEPLITDEVYAVMDYWLDINHINLDIGFTTNFTNLTYKNKDILKYWKSFPKLIVSASLDDSGPRAEYLRKGTRWQKIIDNRIRMLNEAPEVLFEITPTISVFNVWHFPDFHLDWLEKGYLDDQNIRLNLLTNPSSMAINIIHPERRKPIIAKWIKSAYRLAEIKSINLRFFNKSIEAYKSVIYALKNEPYVDLRQDFFERNNLVDSIRKEVLYDAYPELFDILSNPE